MKNNIEVIGSQRIILGVIILIIMGLSLHLTKSKSLIGFAVHFFVGLPLLVLFCFIILFDFIRIRKNDGIKVADKSKIRLFLSIILVLDLLSLVPPFFFEFVIG